MYIINKRESFSDILELKDSKGKSVEIGFTLKTSPQNIKEYRKLYVEFIDLQKQAQSDGGTEEALEKIGRCVVDLFDLIFGAENTKVILEFYDGDYAEMVIDIFPYIQDVVAPQFNQAVKAMRKNIKRRFGK